MSDPYSPAAIAYYRGIAENGPYSPKAAAYYQGKPYVSAELPISQLVQYTQGRQNAQLAYETGTAQNQFNREQTMSRYTNLDLPYLENKYSQFTLPNLQQKIALSEHATQRAGEKIPQDMAGRGIAGSGVQTQTMQEWAYQKAAQDFQNTQALNQAGFEQQHSVSDLQYNYMKAMGQYGINDQALAKQYFTAESQINQQEQAARLDLAAEIRAFA